MKWLYVLAIIILAGCARTAYVPVETVITETYRDTVLVPKKDSASIKALLECDSLGNVRLKELNEKSGAYTQQNIQLIGKMLNIDTNVNPPEFTFMFKNTHTATKVPYPVEKELTWWQQLRINSFWFLLAAVAILLLMLRR